MNNNPAARLHFILEKSRATEVRNKPMMEGWRTVLSLPNTMDDLTTMQKLGGLFSLTQVVSDHITKYPDLDHNLYLGWRNDLCNSFKQINFSAKFNAFSSTLSDSLLINIQFCAHELGKRKPEKVIEEAQLQELKDEASKLYDQILESDLDSEISEYLADLTYRFVDAIDNYLITGSLGIQRALDSAVGTVITTNKIATSSKETSEGKAFWNIAGKTAILLNLAKTVMELGEGIGTFIGEGK